MSATFYPERPTIGVLAGWQIYWTARPLSYLNPIFRGIRLAAADLGCNLLLGCGMGPTAASSDPLRPAWPFHSPETDFVPIGPWNTDGLIAINPLHSETRSRDLQQLRAAGHPVQFIGSGERGPTIVADNAGGIRAAMEHLVTHGHRSVAFIAGSQDDMAGDSGARLAAYWAALADYGLVRDERLVAYSEHTYDTGDSAMRQILNSGAAFTAVLASNDESAFGAMPALAAAGLRIPQDVAVIGFDDRPECTVQEPALTSVHIPLFKMGYRAVELLLQQIRGCAEATEPVKIPTRLVQRESCGCGLHQPQTVPLAASAPAVAVSHPFGGHEHLARAMAEAVLAEIQNSNFDVVHRRCQRLITVLVAGVEQGDRASYQLALAGLLRETQAEGDDMHAWQAAVSLLGSELPALFASWEQPATRDLARELVDWTRVAVSAATLRQHQQFVVDQGWMAGRIGLLTARLLNALDEAQVYQILAQHLPEMGIQTAVVALFEAEGEDPVAWSSLRNVTAPDQRTRRFRTRNYPPPDPGAGNPQFSQALLPLVNQRGQLGYMAFDTVHLDLYGAIAQQIAGALNTAQLYREATEGRRLAEEADQMKSHFLSTVSHELRTPLNLIVGLSGILLRENDETRNPLPAATRKDIERIYSNAQHLGGLIGDVLDLASSDAGQLRLTYEFVDLGQALRMVADTGRQLTSDKGLAWHAVLPEAGPWVWGDRTRLRQVALNLIYNAVKFTTSGEVGLRVEQVGETVTISVHDSGIGLPLAEQTAIFEAFKRSERSIRQGYGGIGLGLTICKRLVALHQGSMGVHSSGEEGAGSVFYFTLPTVTPPSPVSAGLPLPQAPGADRVLVLSSEPGGGRLQEELERRGLNAQVYFMHDSAGWLAHLLLGEYSAVVLDISQGSERAWESLKMLKNNPATQHIPALFYAASSAGGAVLELDYLTKPIELTSLTRALDQQWLASGPGARARTFLVVDDDSDTLGLHRRIIQSQSRSNRVLTAGNGYEALQILQHREVDLVVLDLMMPGLDGFGVLEAMQADKRTRDIPAIVITGQVLTEAEMTRLTQGVAMVMSKGVFSLDETLAQLQATLERRHKLSDDAQRAVRKAMAYIHEHYTEPISRHDLARYVSMSDDYLTHCFRQELGMTPIAYLNRFRVTQAKRLLTETNRSITAIALDVGFSTSGYFSRMFHREVGASPETFRRQREA